MAAFFVKPNCKRSEYRRRRFLETGSQALLEKTIKILRTSRSTRILQNHRQKKSRARRIGSESFVFTQSLRTLSHGFYQDLSDRFFRRRRGRRKNDVP